MSVPIDRRGLVQRHNPVLRGFDPRSPLSVGNGELAFTVDCTGLQTFRARYDQGTPLCTQAQWGWHSFPAAESTSLRLQDYDAGGKTVGYATSAQGQEELFDRLRRNPHRLNLAAIGLRLTTGPGDPAGIDVIHDIQQELDLWTGCIESRWSLEGAAAVVRTRCHPRSDTLSVQVESALCASGRLAVIIEFPYGSPEMNASDWSSPGKHRSQLFDVGASSRGIRRTLDATRYVCTVTSDGKKIAAEGDHRFAVRPARGSALLSLTVGFSPGTEPAEPVTCREVETESADHWGRFWQDGGCLACAESTDPRGVELERRVVLSQYLTAIQCSGSLPPQETGLTCNSWYGKFHIEMHYWHAAHFAAWGRTGMLERSMGWYSSVLDTSRRRARDQGYAGARWPKMVGPEGRDSPSPIGPLLIWQQPHPIMLAELVRRARPETDVLRRYADIVFASAEFMASFVRFEPAGLRYVLGPPLIPAQENHAPMVTLNPTFELEYWGFGLRAANEWRRRMGLEIDVGWQQIAERLAALPTMQGRYLAHERCPDTFGAFATDHPAMLAALGMLPGRGVDLPTMSRTLDAVLKHWDFSSAWGWDFPLMAMTAARLGRPRDAVDALLMECPKNTWLRNGHNPQLPRKDLPLYLPSNGGLLLAVALVAAGWGDASQTGAASARSDAPGFPSDGTWSVTSEGLLPLP